MLKGLKLHAQDIHEHVVLARGKPIDPHEIELYVLIYELAALRHSYEVLREEILVLKGDMLKLNGQVPKV